MLISGVPAVCSDIIRGTFKGFALLRQATQPGQLQIAPAPRPAPVFQSQPLNRPVYAPGYGEHWASCRGGMPPAGTESISPPPSKQGKASMHETSPPQPRTNLTFLLPWCAGLIPPSQVRAKATHCAKHNARRTCQSLSTAAHPDAYMYALLGAFDALPQRTRAASLQPPRLVPGIRVNFHAGGCLALRSAPAAGLSAASTTNKSTVTPRLLIITTAP